MHSTVECNSSFIATFFSFPVSLNGVGNRRFHTVLKASWKFSPAVSPLRIQQTCSLSVVIDKKINKWIIASRRIITLTFLFEESHTDLPKFKWRRVIQFWKNAGEDEILALNFCLALICWSNDQRGRWNRFLTSNLSGESSFNLE